MVELASEREADAVSGVGVDVAAVRDEGYDAALGVRQHAVAGPAQGADVAVVEAVLERGLGARGVGLGDAGVELRILEVGGIVVRGRLAHRPGRVADDHADVELPLARRALVVLREEPGASAGPAFRELERVGENDAREGLVGTGSAGEVVIGALDVDGRDVVGEQQDLVGVQLGRVLAGEVVGPHEPRLEQAHDEGARAREGIEHVDALVGEARPEMAAQSVVGRAQDEVDDLHRRVDDAQRLGRLRQRLREEALVELGDDALLAAGVVDALGAELHVGVEALEGLGLLPERMVAESFEQGLHRLRDGIRANEVVIAEERVEDRTGDEVLGDHGQRIIDRDAVVQVGAQPCQELLEDGRQAEIRIGDQRADPRLVLPGNLCDVGRPVLPVVAGADLLDDLRVDGAAQLVDGEVEGELPRLLALAARDLVALLAQPDRLDLDHVRRLVVQVEFVDDGVQAIVVGPQRVQDLPDDLEALVVGQRVLGRDAGRDPDREDHVAEPLSGRLAHHAPDGLDHVDHRVARLEEDDGVEGGHVDALGEAAGVRQDPADLGLRRLLQPLEQVLALEGVEAAVHVLHFRRERPLAVGRVALGHLGEELLELLGVRDRGGEGDRGLHRDRVVLREGLAAGVAFGESVQAADDPRCVVELELVVLVGELALEGGSDGLLVHGQDQHLVVGEKISIDGLPEADAVQLGAVDLLVVHRRDHRARRCGLRLRRVGVHARRGRHVETLGGGNVLVVVDPGEVRFVRVGERDARRPVRLVADHEVEAAEAGLLRGRDHRDRLIGREDDPHLLGLRPLRVLQQLLRVGGRGQEQVVRREVLALAPPAGLLVGAHCEREQRNAGIRGPFLEGLGQQGDRREEDQHGPPCADQLLGDAEARVGLTGPTGHDQLAAVDLLEAVENGRDRVALVGEGRLARLAAESRLRFVPARPVDARRFQLAERDLDRRLVLAFDGPLEVPGPAVRRRDDHPLSEGRLARAGEEGAQVAHVERGRGRVALALDRGEPRPVSVLGHEVDPRVDLAFAPGPVPPAPDLGESGEPEWVGAQVGEHQPLEAVAALCFRGGARPDLLDQVMDRRCHVGTLRGCAHSITGHGKQQRENQVRVTGSVT